jgi:hypothetical protein
LWFSTLFTKNAKRRGTQSGAGSGELRIELRRAMYYSQRYGEVAERFKAAVLKTAEPKGSVSSNLTLSAIAFFRNTPPIQRQV